MKKMSKRSAIIAGSAAAVIAVGGAAFAAWTASGTDNGTATAGTLTAPTVSDVVVDGQLVPGGTANLTLKVTNNHSKVVKISALAAQEDITSNNAGCTAANHAVSLDAAAVSGVVSGLDNIEPGATVDVSVPNGVKMGDSANECQGATFTIPVEAQVATVAS